MHIQLPLRGAGAQRLKGVLFRLPLIRARIARPRAAEMAAPTTMQGVRCCSGYPVSLAPLKGELPSGVLANCIALSRLKRQAAPLHCVARPYPHKALRLCGVPIGLRGLPGLCHDPSGRFASTSPFRGGSALNECGARVTDPCSMARKDRTQCDVPF